MKISKLASIFLYVGIVLVLATHVFGYGPAEEMQFFSNGQTNACVVLYFMNPGDKPSSPQARETFEKVCTGMEELGFSRRDAISMNEPAIFIRINPIESLVPNPPGKRNILSISVHESIMNRCVREYEEEMKDIQEILRIVASEGLGIPIEYPTVDDDRFREKCIC